MIENTNCFFSLNRKMVIAREEGRAHAKEGMNSLFFKRRNVSWQSNARIPAYT
jgi:hypothetical protein